MKANEDKIEVIFKLKSPNEAKDVKFFLGAIKYLAIFSRLYRRRQTDSENSD